MFSRIAVHAGILSRQWVGHDILYDAKSAVWQTCVAVYCLSGSGRLSSLEGSGYGSAVFYFRLYW